MNRALFDKAVRDGRLLLVALVAVMFGFAWLNIWVTSMISLPAFADFLTQVVPHHLERLSPVPFSEVATPAGRIAVIFVHPVVLFTAAVWSIARGSDCVSGEIGRGTMEMLLAQPVSRTTVFATQALATILGAAILAVAAWCGIAIGLATVELPDAIPASRFIPAAVNLLTRMICLAGMSALISSFGSQRWRTVGLLGAWYIASMILEIVGRISDSWHWVSYLTFMTAYSPQAMVARPAEAWALFDYRDGVVAGIGLGGQQLVLVGLGMICYIAGAIIFSRREIPAPL